MFMVELIRYKTFQLSQLSNEAPEKLLTFIWLNQYPSLKHFGENNLISQSKKRNCLP